MRPQFKQFLKHHKINVMHVAIDAVYSKCDGTAGMMDHGRRQTEGKSVNCGVLDCARKRS